MMRKRKTTSVNPGQQSRTDGVLSHERNWSELPQDILHLFSKKLPDISDFIRFRSVCKNWQLSAPVTDPPPQLPWLLECCQGSEENAIIRFYCLSSGKVHTITCPGPRRAWLRGSACRYLFASNSSISKMYLLNPLTNDQIHIPFIDTSWCLEYIGPDSIEGGDMVVISGYGVVDMQLDDTLSSFMAFWRPEADDWVSVEGVGSNANACYMGQYFCDDGEIGFTNVIDIATKKLAYQVPLPKGTNPLLYGNIIMVESGGKILRLFQQYKDGQCHFDIYSLYFGDGEPKPYWMKITEIGDQMLFLENNRGLSFCASNFTGFKGNCIYFLQMRQDLCRYDIGDGTTEVLPCPFDSMETWFVPSLL